MAEKSDNNSSSQAISSTSTKRHKQHTASQSGGTNDSGRRPVCIARNHRMFANMQAALSNGPARSAPSPKTDSSVKYSCESQATTSQAQAVIRNCDIDEIVAKLDSLSFDRHVADKQIKEFFAERNLTFSDDDWRRIATQVIELGMKGSVTTAIDVSVIGITNESFQLAIAEAISQLMAQYVLDEGKFVEQERVLPELVGRLLVANWPRTHSHCNLESNAILYHIVSSIKGWLITIVSESDEDEDVESRCACALSSILRFAQRRMWMAWPELVDECYVAMRESLTDNILLSRAARKALLNALLQMENWTSRRNKSTANAVTQTDH